MLDNKIRRGRPLLVAACALLGACANGVSINDTWVQAYPGARRPPDEVATIARGWGAGFPAAVDGVNYTNTRPMELNGIEILPGDHVVMLHCISNRVISGMKTAEPSAGGRFLAGHVYRASCRNNGKSASAVIEDLGIGHPDMKAPR